MTNQPAPPDAPPTPPSAPRRGSNRFAIILAVGLLVAAAAVGGGAWWQHAHGGAAYLSRAAAYHAALTRLRSDFETRQPPETVERDWEAAKAKGKEWEEYVREEDENRPITGLLRGAFGMYGNAVHYYPKAYERTKAGTQPTSAPAEEDIGPYLANAATALDRVAPDLKQ